MLRQMPKTTASGLLLGDAARALGVSPDTLRRWERAGKLRTLPNHEMARVLDLFRTYGTADFPDDELRRLASH